MVGQASHYLLYITLHRFDIVRTYKRTLARWLGSGIYVLWGGEGVRTVRIDIEIVIFVIDSNMHFDNFISRSKLRECFLLQEAL